MDKPTSIRLPPKMRRRASRVARAGGGESASHVFRLCIEGVLEPDARKLRTVRLWMADADARGRRP